MSGHSKWATIKRKKASADARRGQAFTRLAKEIAIAAREGPDPDSNFRLRLAVDKARAENMPKENIERAIKKGTGELPGVTYEESRYECYAPGGVAMIVDVLTDNKNRTVGEIRHLLTKNGGNMAESGAVVWNFEPKGSLSIAKGGMSDDEIFEKVVEAGAEDVDTSGEMADISTAAGDLHTVAAALEEMGFKPENIALIMKPKTTVSLTGKEAQSVLRLMELLEDHDDVQDVYANFDISEEEMAAMLSE